ncbi:MAG TPA: oxygen-independent coproporphyrinogen III oxidase [Microscillaceae bacterium]|jgi:oxygen-independent coproporphyrinogen-3 oxidase|nr:oxygen-independent coproporphyrinogen III oxidase [Microscillaceae bacterium]
MQTHSLHTLLEKYNIPTPRYTSYPTVPFWDEATFHPDQWLQKIRQAYQPQAGLSLYIHLPFCEQLCTYCGCNKRITVNHKVEQPYIEALWQEWELYQQAFDDRPRLTSLHLGGGTPTFFSPTNLTRLLSPLLQSMEIADEADFSIEVHPNYTQPAHLEALYALGFRRLSVGVQDFDPVVQQAINRPQTVAQTRFIIDEARRIGFNAINIDLIYGLPKQTRAGFSNTLEQVQHLHPDRVALYSYAHVPWKSAAQRHYSEADLPANADKFAIFEVGRQAFLSQGYVEVGFDHFALPHDTLAQALQQGTLHRNFMGYTHLPTQVLIGLGASSIGDSGDAFAQNHTTLETYQATVASGQLPLSKGHFLTAEDRYLRKHILALMCQSTTTWSDAFRDSPLGQAIWERLAPFVADGLITLTENSLHIHPEAAPFLRNIAMQWDARYWDKQQTLAEKPIFSKSV